MTTQAQHRKKRLRTYTHCAHCGKLKPIPETKILPRHEYERDPYCSRRCCEEDLSPSDGRC